MHSASTLRPCNRVCDFFPDMAFKFFSAQPRTQLLFSFISHLTYYLWLLLSAFFFRPKLSSQNFTLSSHSVSLYKGTFSSIRRLIFRLLQDLRTTRQGGKQHSGCRQLWVIWGKILQIPNSNRLLLFLSFFQIQSVQLVFLVSQRETLGQRRTFRSNSWTLPQAGNSGAPGWIIEGSQ